MILYRPVSFKELELMYDAGMRAFPARLPHQPVFYPVLELEYARQVAGDWNARHGQVAGYVTEFKVEDPYIGRFKEHTVRGTQYQEFWIPADELEEFSRHIVGHIKVVEAYFGDTFEGFIPEQFGMQGKDAVEQFTLLANSYLYKRMDFFLEIKRNHKAVFLNYPFWQKHEFKNVALKDKILQAIKEAWIAAFPKIPLPNPPREEISPSKPEEKTDSDSEVDALHAEDSGPAQPAAQTDSEDWMDSDDEEHSGPVVNALREPAADPYARHLAHRDHPSNDIMLIEETDVVDPDPVQENTTPSKGTHSFSWPDSDDEDVTLGELIDSDSREADVEKENTLPKETDSHLARGIKLGLSGKYRDAITELSRASKEDDQDVVAQTSLGVAFHRLNEDDRALSCYEAVLKLDPRYAEAHYFRANILYARGHVREAITGYTRAIGLQPELIRAHERPAPQDRLVDYSASPAALHRIARLAQRILDLNRSLETHPRQANLFKERAAEYSRLGNYEQAIADYSAALALQPEDADALHARGLAYEALGQSDPARQDYQRAMTINPQLSDAYLNRGVTLGSMGNLRQSIDSLTEGIRLAPRNPIGYFNRGASYLQLGDLERAIADFSDVIRLAPGDEAAYYWRGIANEEAGRQREAIADYKQFLELAQDPQAREEVAGKLSLWLEGRGDIAGMARDLLGKLGRYVRRRETVPEDQHETNQVEAEQPAQPLDLYDLVFALGERAVNSAWLAQGVDCTGESAEELLSYTGQDQPIPGQDFLRLTAGIQQTMAGDFWAFDPDSTVHWIFIRLWEGNGFYVETNDRKSKHQLRAQFPWAEDVEGAAPPYEGLLIRT